jgi:hypothetical protein
MNDPIHFLAASVNCQLDRKLEEPQRSGLDTVVIKRKTPTSDQTLAIHPIHRLLNEPSVLTLTMGG